jgi:hypothetical protein
MWISCRPIISATRATTTHLSHPRAPSRPDRRRVKVTRGRGYHTLLRPRSRWRLILLFDLLTTPYSVRIVINRPTGTPASSVAPPRDTSPFLYRSAARKILTRGNYSPHGFGQITPLFFREFVREFEILPIYPDTRSLAHDLLPQRS